MRRSVSNAWFVGVLVVGKEQPLPLTADQSLASASSRAKFDRASPWLLSFVSRISRLQHSAPICESEKDDNRERDEKREKGASIHSQRRPSLNPATDRDSESKTAIKQTMASQQRIDQSSRAPIF
jgi:hypothetical protein